MSCSMTRTGKLALALVILALGAVHAGELSRPVPSNAQVTRFTRFNISYALRDVVADSIQRVEFYITDDMGRTWRLYGEDADRMSPMTIEVPGEGVYGFVCVVTDTYGNRELAPKERTRPETVIVVDKTPPEAKWVAPAQNILGRGRPVDLTWEASDPYFSASPVRVQYAANAASNHDRDAAWTNLQEGLSASGATSWTPPAGGGSARYNFRFIAEDRAGNMAVAYCPATVNIDSEPPSVTSLSPLKSNTLENDIIVQADDGASGSGVKEISLYTSENGGGTWVLVKETTDIGESLPVKRASGQGIPFTAGQPGEFALWPVVFDEAGNATPLPSIGVPGPHILTIDNEPPVVTLSDSFLMGRAAILANETRSVNWTAYDPHVVNGSGVILLSLDNGSTWQEVRSGLPASGTETINFPFGSQSEEARIKVTVADDFGNVGEAESVTFKLSGANTVVDSVTPVAPGGGYEDIFGGQTGGMPPVIAPAGDGSAINYPPPAYQGGTPPASPYPDPYGWTQPELNTQPLYIPPEGGPAWPQPALPPATGGPSGETTANAMPRAMTNVSTSAPTQSTPPVSLQSPGVTPQPQGGGTGMGGWTPSPSAGQASGAGAAAPDWTQIPPPAGAPVPGQALPVPAGPAPTPPPPPPPSSSAAAWDAGLGGAAGLMPPPPLSTPSASGTPPAPLAGVGGLDLQIPGFGGEPPALPAATIGGGAGSSLRPPGDPAATPAAPAMPPAIAAPLPPPAVTVPSTNLSDLSGGIGGTATLPATPALPAAPAALPPIGGDLTAPPIERQQPQAPGNPRQLSEYKVRESRAFLDEGRVDMALNAANEAVAADQSNPGAYVILSQVWSQQEPPDYIRAAMAAKEATNIGRDWDSWWNCADIFYLWAHVQNQTVQEQIRSGGRAMMDTVDQRNQALENARIAASNAASLVQQQGGSEEDRKKVANTQGLIAYLRARTIPEPVNPGDGAPQATMDEFRRAQASYKASVTPMLLEALPHFRTAMGLAGAPGYTETFHLGIINFRLGNLERETGNLSQAMVYYQDASSFLEEATNASGTPVGGPREAYYMIAFCYDLMSEEPGPSRTRYKELALRYWQQTVNFYPPGTAYRDYGEQRLEALQLEMGR